MQIKVENILELIFVVAGIFMMIRCRAMGESVTNWNWNHWGIKGNATFSSILCFIVGAGFVLLPILTFAGIIHTQ